MRVRSDERYYSFIKKNLIDLSRALVQVKLTCHACHRIMHAQYRLLFICVTKIPKTIFEELHNKQQSLESIFKISK